MQRQLSSLIAWTTTLEEDSISLKVSNAVVCVLAGPPANLPQPGGSDWAGSGGAANKRPHASGAEAEDNGADAAQPPAHDVFRQRRKLQRSRAAGGEG